MSQPIINVKNISKRYILGQFNAMTLRDEVERFFERLRGRSDAVAPSTSEFWALKDVSFSVDSGEVIGIIGRNGAGKSTLLKIMSRITEPTGGEIQLRGRIASLLEVGTGFHPDLSGRENIYLNGAILGMTRAEIRAKFDEIVDFAEVEKFLDTPVKRYSSGMYVRLAFAVAAHLEPEVLVVDEVLAVGDAEFQKKCLGKMKSVSVDSGRTVLFVSHNMQAISSLCSRAILLEKGRIADSGPASDVVSRYLQGGAGNLSRSRVHTWDAPGDAPGNSQVRVKKVGIIADDEATLETDSPISLEICFWNLMPGAKPHVNLMLYSITGGEVLEDWSASELGWKDEPMQVGLFRTVCTIPANLLNEGTYRVRIVFFDNNSVRVAYDMEDALCFEVFDLQTRVVSWNGRFIGFVHPKLEWKTTLLETLDTTQMPQMDGV